MAEASSSAILHAIPRRDPYAEFEFSLPSVVAIVSPVVDAVVSRIGSLRGDDTNADTIELALREALVNAVVHGNREDPFKRVYVTLRCSAEGEVQITIRDEGAGFDVASVPDPTTPENLLWNHGRGIFLMRALMDEVSFKNGGSVVQMRKKAPLERRKIGC